MEKDIMDIELTKEDLNELTPEELVDLKIQEGLVPRVIGLGAKDAVYLMEKAGLQVSLSGIGRVVTQSVSPGRKIHKGQKVLLTLR